MPNFSHRNISLLLLLGLVVFYVCEDASAALGPKSFAVKNNDVHYDMVVHIDPIEGTLHGKTIITIQRPKELRLMLGSTFDVTKATFNGGELGAGRADIDQPHIWHIPFNLSQQHQFEIHWQGSLNQLSHFYSAKKWKPMTVLSGAQATFLPDTSLWYPRVVDTFATYKVELKLPASQRGLVAGKLIEEQSSKQEYRTIFEYSHPSEGIDLIAGPYLVSTQVYSRNNGEEIQLRTYLHPQIKQFSSDYFASVKRYLSRYETQIGAYPHDTFSVVSSLKPNVFSIPTITFQSVDVLKFPVKSDAVISHDLLHNWWGNGVFADYRGGNWAEGLTTFMAHSINQQQDDHAARDTRLTWIHDLALLPTEQDIPLQAFDSRIHGVNPSIGRYKSAMFFSMLRDYLGETVFQQGIQALWSTRRFQITSWQQLQQLLEIISGRPLEKFFKQWIDQKGLPTLSIKEAKGESSTSDAYRITLTLQQSSPPYQLRVPIMIESEHGKETQWIDFTQQQQNVSIKSSSKPLFVALDPDYRLLRRLPENQMPLSLHQIASNPMTQTILLSQRTDVRELASVLAMRFLKHFHRIITATPKLLTKPTLVIGLQSEIEGFMKTHQIEPLDQEIKTDSTAQVWSTRLHNGTPIVLASAENISALSAIIRRLPRHDKNSYVIFKGNQVIEKGLWSRDTSKIKVSW